MKSYPNGCLYEGWFSNNEPHGNGRMIFPFGERHFLGNWEKGKRNGYGVIHLSDGESYKGQWKDNKFDGKGCYEYANSGRYNGEWKQGEKHGEGVY